MKALLSLLRVYYDKKSILYAVIVFQLKSERYEYASNVY